MDLTVLGAMPAVAIGAFLLAALGCRWLPARWSAATAKTASLIAVVSVAIAAIGFGAAGPSQWPASPTDALGFGVRIDPINLLALGVVSFVGLVVISFSRAYLDGNPRQPIFFSRLCATLAAVLLLVSSGTLIQLLCGWVLTSLTLHQLLTFYPDRPIAQLAARKKFWIARVADSALLASVALLIQQFGTIEIAAINEMAHSATNTGSMTVATLLIVVAALLKSAQFPLHGWLTEVMETPTPVSALLHAGIVNGGGYLVIRFADVVVTNEAAMLTLVVVGGLSALVASVFMLTQSTVKVQLGYSTVAQMGFMMLQCGLGAFSAAALHLVAHSFYKAHSFLASGNAVEQVRDLRLAELEHAQPTAWRLVGALVAALAIYAAIAVGLDQLIQISEGVLLLGVIYIVGLFGFIARGFSGQGIVLPVVRHAATATLLYFGLQTLSLAFFRDYLPPVTSPTTTATLITISLIILFSATALLQFSLTRIAGPRMHALFVAVRNGFYLNDYLNNLAGAYRRATH